MDSKHLAVTPAEVTVQGVGLTHEYSCCSTQEGQNPFNVFLGEATRSIAVQYAFLTCYHPHHHWCPNHLPIDDHCHKFLYLCCG